MQPGEHLIIIGTELDAVEARANGLQLRDSVLILLPGLRTLTAYLFRTPIDGTVADNVLKHGTSALHIDACRIFTDWHEPDRPESWKRSGNTAKPDAVKIAAPPGNGITCHPGGRWPTNMVLVHGPGCMLCGSKVVKGITGGENVVRRSGAHSEAGGHQTIGRVQTPRRGHASKDGTETVDAWDCQPDCPVAWLDAMSGELRTNPGRITKSMASMGYHKGSGSAREVRKDAGGASRFYPQFAGLPAAVDWLARLIGV